MRHWLCLYCTCRLLLVSCMKRARAASTAILKSFGSLHLITYNFDSSADITIANPPRIVMPSASRQQKRRDRKNKWRLENETKAKDGAVRPQSPKTTADRPPVKQAKPWPKTKQDGKAKEGISMKKATAEKKKVEPSSKEMTTLADLEKRTDELETYVNQIQDAFTVGLLRLHDLQNELKQTIAARASGKM
ncbi:hypothetical protein GGS21DRAFT_510177 [Xylaria nigripes]|nr:hypothetical protein GGS21DRAFT_510177 [Xylaria nigripes]